MLLKVDGGVEIAGGLEVLKQIAPALQQQAPVHGAFLIDRDQLAQFAVGHFRACGLNLHQRPVVDGDGGSHGVGTPSYFRSSSVTPAFRRSEF